MSFVANLVEVRQRIAAALSRAGREDPVKLVAVSKTFPVEIVQSAVEAGQTIFGENYVQEGCPKVDRLRECASNPRLEFHFIGRLQRNKVRDVVGRFDLVQSVDRPELAVAIAAEARRRGIVQGVLLQVNISDEAQKGGVAPEQAGALLGASLAEESLDVRGLMMIGKLFGQRSEEHMVRGEFRRLRELRERLRRETGAQLPELSMGMSGDYDWAVEEGATIVRVGSALFGRREQTV